MIQFWLSSPVDLLESLWNLKFGQLTIACINNLSPSFAFTPEQVDLRNRIGSFFKENGMSHPLSQNLMLANFLLSPPGLLKIHNVSSFFPAWLVEIYNTVYESSLDVSEITSPDQQVDGSSISVNQSSSDSSFSAPILPPFPSSISDLVSDRVQLNRLLGLSNLYYIDPEDVEIKSELAEIRSKLATAILSCPEDSSAIWATDLGDRYWSLVRSGFQAEPLSESDTLIKNNSVSRLNPSSGGGFGTPGAINSFLVAMMYFLPGTVKVDDPQNKLPHWLLSAYLEIFSNALE